MTALRVYKLCEKDGKVVEVKAYEDENRRAIDDMRIKYFLITSDEIRQDQLFNSKENEIQNMDMLVQVVSTVGLEPLWVKLRMDGSQRSEKGYNYESAATG